MGTIKHESVERKRIVAGGIELDLSPRQLLVPIDYPISLKKDRNDGGSEYELVSVGEHREVEGRVIISPVTQTRFGQSITYPNAQVQLAPLQTPRWPPLGVIGAKTATTTGTATPGFIGGGETGTVALAIRAEHLQVLFNENYVGTRPWGLMVYAFGSLVDGRERLQANITFVDMGGTSRVVTVELGQIEQTAALVRMMAAIIPNEVAAILALSSSVTLTSITNLDASGSNRLTVAEVGYLITPITSTFLGYGHATAQVSVGTTATLIDMTPGRRSLTIRNTSAATDVYIGDETVTTTTGHLVSTASAMTIDHSLRSIFGIVAAGSATVSKFVEL